MLYFKAIKPLDPPFQSFLPIDAKGDGRDGTCYRTLWACCGPGQTSHIAARLTCCVTIEGVVCSDRVLIGGRLGQMQGKEISIERYIKTCSACDSSNMMQTSE